MNRLGMSARKTRHGSARPVRTRRSGIHRRPSSSWAGPTRTSSIIRRRSPLN
jgi:hypothetical protein